MKLWVQSSEKAFGAELCPKVPFSVTSAATPCSRRRHCRPLKCFPPSLSRLAPQINNTSDRQEPRRDEISSSLSPCHHRTGRKWQPRPGWLVCAKPTSPRKTVDLTTKMSGPILFACTLLRVRVTCGVDSLLALRSRKSF